MNMDIIRSDQRDAATDTLAEAFREDPLMHILAPDEERRFDVGRWFFGVTVDYGMRWGRVWVNEESSAVSVWLPPETTWSAGRSFRVGMGAFPIRVGVRAMARVMRAAPALDRLHGAVSKRPHWYLMAIGTLPDRQRSGLGSALVAAGTSQADKARVPCYLETATSRNVEFFGRHGFDVTGTEHMHGYQIFGMVRQPG
jgi:ribosomal protein S18 acetylase RimI-like enzyme